MAYWGQRPPEVEEEDNWYEKLKRRMRALVMQPEETPETGWGYAARRFQPKPVEEVERERLPRIPAYLAPKAVWEVAEEKVLAPALGWVGKKAPWLMEPMAAVTEPISQAGKALASSVLGMPETVRQAGEQWGALFRGEQPPEPRIKEWSRGGAEQYEAFEAPPYVKGALEFAPWLLQEPIAPVAAQIALAKKLARGVKEAAPEAK